MGMRIENPTGNYLIDNLDFVSLGNARMLGHITGQTRVSEKGVTETEFSKKSVPFSNSIEIPSRYSNPISPIHTFVNIPALIRKRSVLLSSRAGILTKV